MAGSNTIFIGNGSEVLYNAYAELIVSAATTPANTNGNTTSAMSMAVSNVYVLMASNTTIGTNAAVINPVSTNIATLQLALTSMNAAVTANVGGFSNTDQTNIMANVGLLFAQTNSLLVHTNILSSVTPVGAAGSPGTPADFTGVLGAGVAMNGLTNTVNGTQGCFNLLGMLSALLSGPLLGQFTQEINFLIGLINTPGTLASFVINAINAMITRIINIIVSDIQYYLNVVLQMNLFSFANALIAALSNPCAAFLLAENVAGGALTSGLGIATSALNSIVTSSGLGTAIAGVSSTITGLEQGVLQSIQSAIASITPGTLFNLGGASALSTGGFSVDQLNNSTDILDSSSTIDI